ncbi:C40 family peptidase [Stutzerimonas azotifigens]|uniref:C40 family peptidase n=1 Tax=Stutzerimonas azotifigens TaxID=291995 RepID=UPI00040356C9|nr:C40 family peptidase [Stutzerimonas azotifigens]
MRRSAHLMLVITTLLLGACAGRAPEPVAPVPIAGPASEYPGTAEDVLFNALSLVGTPYRYGGNTPDSGFDCSGLIGYVYRHGAGLALPRTTADLMRMRAERVRADALRAGDLVFFATAGGRRVSHAGIYVGEGRFVHAPSSGGTVRLDSLSSHYWQKSYLDARRVLGSEALARNP